MSKVFLSDMEIKDNLFPFTLTRSAADIRVGILTIRQKWEAYLGAPVNVTGDGAASPERDIPHESDMILSANIIPSQAFVDSLFAEGRISDNPNWSAVRIIQFPWHIFFWNDWALREDFRLITRGRTSAVAPASVQLINSDNIFIEEGARLSCCIINAEAGPVYIGRNAQVMEGSIIRGPFALCEGATLKMGSRVYGATTIGPNSIAGGEIKNSVIFGNSNKAHDGYLGDSVVGEWCNLGAGTSSSNIKNNAGTIKLWNNIARELVSAGITKCGLIMGDYSRAAINTSFNTGTVVGVSANVFGEGLTPKFIRSFSWGSKGAVRYEFERAMADIDNWKKLKNAALTEQEKTRLRLIFDQN